MDFALSCKQANHSIDAGHRFTSTSRHLAMTWAFSCPSRGRQQEILSWLRRIPSHHGATQRFIAGKWQRHGHQRPSMGPMATTTGPMDTKDTFTASRDIPASIQDFPDPHRPIDGAVIDPDQSCVAYLWPSSHYRGKNSIAR